MVEKFRQTHSSSTFKIRNKLNAQFSKNFYPGIKAVNLEEKEEEKKGFEFLGITIGKKKPFLILSYNDRIKVFRFETTSSTLKKKITQLKGGNAKRSVKEVEIYIYRR